MIKVPTDNLYKFIAIAGFLVFISGAFIMYSVNESVILSSHVVEDTKIAMDKFDDVSGRDLSLLSENERVEIESELLGINQDFGGITSELNLRNKQNQFRLNLSVFLMISGGLIAFYGFYNWYHKLQVYIDKAYRNGAISDN